MAGLATKSCWLDSACVRSMVIAWPSSFLSDFSFSPAVCQNQYKACSQSDLQTPTRIPGRYALRTQVLSSKYSNGKAIPSSMEASHAVPFTVKMPSVFCLPPYGHHFSFEDIANLKWLWVQKNVYPKWNPGKWTHEPKPGPLVV